MDKEGETDNVQHCRCSLTQATTDAAGRSQRVIRIGSKGIDFLEADKADAEPALNLKKELVVCATLIGAMAVF